MGTPIVLASGSPHRRALLDRLGLPYTATPPDLDETPLAHETGPEYVARLAQEKAQAVAGRSPQALIIGSDQAAVLDGEILGKPGAYDPARAQLLGASGRWVEFYTGLTVLNTASGKIQTDVVLYSVKFRTLDESTVDSYLQREQPYDCAGSFKSEGLGVVLFERMQGDDPTALIGLPLIRLTDMLLREGVPLP